MTIETEPQRSFVEQLKTLNAYVAPAVAKRAVENPARQLGGMSRRFYAATAFADISGFTPLAEELASRGVRGAEELTAILNQVFADLITVAEAQGGQTEVVKFGGDALSLIWPCDEDEASMAEAVLQAVQTAFAMQASMARFSTLVSSQGAFSLRMKVGISAGELLEVHAGGGLGRWEYVLAGAPMANMSSAENQAQADEVVVDQRAWGLLNGYTLTLDQDERDLFPALRDNSSYVLGQKVCPGFYRITHIGRGAPYRPYVSPEWAVLSEAEASQVSTTLRDYIPGAIKSLLESGHEKMLAELKTKTV